MCCLGHSQAFNKLGMRLKKFWQNVLFLHGITCVVSLRDVFNTRVNVEDDFGGECWVLPDVLSVGDESPDDIDRLPLELVLEVVIVKDLDICTGNKKKTF